MQGGVICEQYCKIFSCTSCPLTSCPVVFPLGAALFLGQGIKKSQHCHMGQGLFPWPVYSCRQSCDDIDAGMTANDGPSMLKNPRERDKCENLRSIPCCMFQKLSNLPLCARHLLLPKIPPEYFQILLLTKHFFSQPK